MSFDKNLTGQKPVADARDEKIKVLKAALDARDREISMWREKESERVAKDAALISAEAQLVMRRKIYQECADLVTRTKGGMEARKAILAQADAQRLDLEGEAP